MNCLVTGAAGFIGSHLCRRLLKEGHYVSGIDSFTDYYPRRIKEANLAPFSKHERFKFFPEDINKLDLNNLLQNIDAVFHLAAQAGVRASWGKNFSIYTRNNIEATQKLLETAKKYRLTKFIYASSSSVYGSSPELPMKETSTLSPFSPYGVSKLAAENLCSLYFRNYGVPTVSLRFFTVYGPGQRPDMAFHRFFKAILLNKPITIYGDGKQTRDFTYVDDIIEANIISLSKGKEGEIYNIGGGNQLTLKNIFSFLEQICQKKIKLQFEKKQKGDVLHTFANIKKAYVDLDYSPKVSLKEGLQKEWNWIQRYLS